MVAINCKEIEMSAIFQRSNETKIVITDNLSKTNIVHFKEWEIS